MKIDLHVHSKCAKGEFNILTLIKLAAIEGLQVISITDKDSIDNIEIIKNSIIPDNISFINGVELSSSYSKYNLDILGYNFNEESRHMKEILDLKKDINFCYISNLITGLKKYKNIIFPREKIIALLSSDKNISQNDVAKLLIQGGYTKNYSDAFKCYLNYVINRVAPYYKEVEAYNSINAINAAGGLSVLAHPFEITKNEIILEKIIKSLVSEGLNGLEVYNPKHTLEEIQKLLYYVRKYDLLISGGTNFYGPTITPDLFLGQISNDNKSNPNLSIMQKIKNK